MTKQYTKEETLASLDRAIADTGADVARLRAELTAKELVLRVLTKTRNEHDQN